MDFDDLDPGGRADAAAPGLGDGPRDGRLHHGLHRLPSLAAVLWGVVAEQTGLVATFLTAAALQLAAVAAGLVLRVPESAQHAPDPVVYWSEAPVSVEPDPATGPVLVTVTYTVAPEHRHAYLAAMRHLRRSRLRTGATRWELYQDVDRRDRYVEQFRVASWEEHQRQHDGRLTSADRAVEEAALAFSDAAATAEHLLLPDDEVHTAVHT